MAERFEWLDASQVRPTIHRKGEEMADGQTVDKPYAIALPGVVIQGTAPELRSLLQRAYAHLQEQVVSPKRHSS